MGLMEDDADGCELHAQHAFHGDHSAPTKDRDQNRDDDSQCCKSLQITLYTPAKNLVNYDSSLFTLHAFFAAIFSYPDSYVLRLNPLEIDTGPPRSISFVESVLQRSILAHAPPVFV